PDHAQLERQRLAAVAPDLRQHLAHDAHPRLDQRTRVASGAIGHAERRSRLVTEAGEPADAAAEFGGRLGRAAAERAATELDVDDAPGCGAEIHLGGLA